MRQEVCSFPPLSFSPVVVFCRLDVRSRLQLGSKTAFHLNLLAQFLIRRDGLWNSRARPHPRASRSSLCVHSATFTGVFEYDGMDLRELSIDANAATDAGSPSSSPSSPASSPSPVSPPGSSLSAAASSEGGAESTGVGDERKGGPDTVTRSPSSLAGDILVLAGVSADVRVGDSVVDLLDPRPLAPLNVADPSVSIQVLVNTSPLAGKEVETPTSGTLLRQRLLAMTERDVSLRVDTTPDDDGVQSGGGSCLLRLSGRGPLHLALVLETLRREGFELVVAAPSVLPRKGDLVDVTNASSTSSSALSTLVFRLPTRKAFGLRSAILTASKGTASIHAAAGGYQVVPKGEETDGLVKIARKDRHAMMGSSAEVSGKRHPDKSGSVASKGCNAFIPKEGAKQSGGFNIKRGIEGAGAGKKKDRGFLVATEEGTVTGKGALSAQERGQLFVSPGDQVYGGMIVGLNSRGGDLPINVCKAKKLTNMRAAHKEISEGIVPPIEVTLDYGMEIIGVVLMISMIIYSIYVVVANDIGYFNYKFFYLTLLYSSLTLSFASATMFPTATAALGDPNIPFETVYFILSGAVLSFCVLCIVGSFFIFHTYLVSINCSTVEYCEKRRGGPGHDWDLGVLKNIKEVLPRVLTVMRSEGRGAEESILREKIRRLTTEHGFDSRDAMDADLVQGVDVHEAKEHGKYSKVRKIDTQLIVALHDMENIAELFTASGYPKCGKYSLCCSPKELGDLGCGFPLFFDFLKMLLVLSATQCIFLSPVLLGVYNFWSHEPSTRCSVYTAVLGTAGCLDARARSSLLPVSMVFVTIVVSVALFPHFSRRQQLVAKMSTDEVIRPDSFAVAVSGLPEDAVDEAEIAKFFEENALFGSRPASIVKVVIGFDVGQYYEYARRQSYLKKKLRRTGKPQDLEEKRLREQLTRLEEKFKSLESMHLRGTGFAIVLFCYQLVRRAPNPSDIQWENLGYSSSRRLLAKVATISIGAIIWFFALSVDVVLLSLNVRIHNESYRGTGLDWFKPVETLIEQIDLTPIREALADPLNMRAHFGHLLLSFAPSVITTIVNGAAGWVLDFMSQYERHRTVTGREASSLLKLTIVFTLNTAVKYIFVLNQSEWCILVEPIVTAFPCQWVLVTEGIPGFRLQSQTLLPVCVLKYDRLATVLKSFALTVMYLPLAPIGGFFGMVMWGIYYWTYKYMLLRRCKRPYVQSALLPETALRLARFFLLFVPLMGTYLLVPSFDASLHFTIKMVMLSGLCVAAFFLVLPGRVAQTLCATHQCQPMKEKTLWETLTYYEAQHMFVDKYHRTNPVYRVLPTALNPDILAPEASRFSSPQNAPFELEEVRPKRRRPGLLTNFSQGLGLQEHVRCHLRATIAANVGVSRAADGRFPRALPVSLDPVLILSEHLPPEIGDAVRRKTMAPSPGELRKAETGVGISSSLHTQSSSSGARPETLFDNSCSLASSDSPHATSNEAETERLAANFDEEGQETQKHLRVESPFHGTAPGSQRGEL
ncbi:GTP-binding protein TypA, related [Neospora caninum Liverpool]|uniref:GTP-binding protein TypA, related n=1 Tax=Neospora caninum (strain Liverpool) TaxID=572307 RepID=F0VCX3_NEOCL|nr:GTP-binding protein TypA, related [Neospora caninum Liverpool]CBZ51488.1 GTP-binding protein TypA, related [Neospora caninum Liverpool]|eukprot:XP_003881521.1 GTP-binding protein TypA, related [Neospora caninum Liverpool]